MNNTSTSFDRSVINSFVQVACTEYIYALAVASCLGLLVYTTLSKLPQEMENNLFNWRSFSLSALLYVFARYGILLYQGLYTWLSLGPQAPGR